MNHSIDSARWMVEKVGWPVFPCWGTNQRHKCLCGKGALCESPGKHPITRNGVKNATTDSAVIDSWHERYPEANWATMPVGGLVVDVDRRKNGFESLDALPFTLPATLRVNTGGGGLHLYFTSGAHVGNRTNWMPGIDIKSEGGYVLLPGSNHISGGLYSWLSQVDMAPAPPDLVESIVGDRVEVSTTVDPSRVLQEGERDAGLFRLACFWRRKLNNDRHAVELLVLDKARNGCDPPFPERDARVKVEQAFKQDHEAGIDPAQQAWVDGLQDMKPRLRLQRSSAVRSRPKPEFLVEDVLPAGSLFQVFGQTGTYKSYVMVDLAASIANGIDFMGHRVSRSGLVALVLGEGGADAGQRIEAWLRGNPGTSDRLLLYSIEEGLDLMDPSHVHDIGVDLQDWRDGNAPDEEWRLIVFDTQADHMASGDEDKSKDFTVVKKSIQRIAKQTGAAVGLVHHTGWDKSRERGSSRQRQALDVVMQVEDETIKNIKQKFGPLFPAIRFTTVPVPEVGNLYVRRKSVEEDFMDLTAQEAERVRALEEDAKRVVRLYLEEPTQSQNALTKAAGIGKATLKEMREWLADSGLIDLVQNGRDQITGFMVTDTGHAWLAEE